MTRIGIIGAGFMGTTHAAAWAGTEATLAAVIAGPDTPAVRLAERYGAAAHDDLDAFLAAVDVVDVCTPTDLHERFVLAAAAAGKAVVCEKPLARTSQEGDRMLAACHENGVPLLVAHVVRFFPEYVAARERVVAGAVGTPAVVRLTRATFQPRKAADNWFVDHARSGGLVFDLMIHDIDYARWIAGDVATVFARSVQGSRAGAPGDHALAILRHRDGALTHLEASWAQRPPTFRTAGEIAGDAGVVSWSSDDSEPVRVDLEQPPDGAGEVPRVASTLAEDPYTTQIRHFLRVLRGEEAPIVTGADGLAAVRVAEAVASSIASGRVVEVPGAQGAPDVGTDREVAR
jgi:predicted dehydrogenase